MIIQKCQCLYNGNFAFGNVCNIQIKVRAFMQSEFLWCLLGFSIFYLESKKKKKSFRIREKVCIFPYALTSSVALQINTAHTHPHFSHCNEPHCLLKNMAHYHYHFR
jgi:hypothetical protein